ncbi:hypothetical protein MKW94_005011 [Papaver nudicaule]|uniref:TF-B3 domain-containing protein n=1 Tax=Papaver nudicaule TaxID=74823 RepID=A0AA42AT33_PAPNU|nr:hypothetical protein [Papaver nudicaule]
MEKNSEDGEEWEQRMYWSKFRVVRFFTVLPKHFHSKLVNKFVKNCVVKELPGTSTVSLKGPSGKSWAVELRRYFSNDDEELYLKKGWEVFAEEHNLKENDVLVFEYKSGGSVFDVLVFDDDSFCKNESSYFVRNDSTESCHGSYGGLNERRRAERAPSMEIFEPKIKRNIGKRIASSDDEQDDSYSGTSRAPGWKGKALVSVEHDQDSEEDSQVNPFALVLEQRSERETHLLFQQAVNEGKRRGRPHFAVIMKRTHVAALFFMTVPVEAARRYIPSGAGEVSLRMGDKIWTVRHKQKGASTGFWGKGWRDFVTRNKVKAKDVCLFEASSSFSPSSSISKNPVIFAVSIFANRR